MDIDQIIVAVVNVLLLLSLIFTRIHPAIIFSGGAVCYLMADLIELTPLLHFYTHPALVTLVLLILISTAFERTKFIGLVIKHCFEGNSFFSLMKTLSLTSILSAFLNNTAVVSVLISGIKRNNYPSHKVLLPVSYAAIIGGTLTLVGTSTNLIINGLIAENGLEPMTLFTFIVPSLFLFFICLPVIVILAIKLLKDEDETIRAKRRYFVEAKLNEASPLVGKTVLDNGLRNLQHLFLVELIRKDQLISPVSPSEVLETGDILIFTGEIERLDDILQFSGLTVFEEPVEVLQRNLVEVVVSPTANIIGKMIKDSDFRSTFDAAVVAIRRGDKQLSGKMGLQKIQPGDSLLLATGRDFHERKNIAQNFYIISKNGAHNKTGWRSWLLGLGLPLSIFLGTYTSTSLPESLLMFILLLIGTGILKPSEIRRRFPFQIILVVGSALAMAEVAFKTGLISLLVDMVLNAQPDMTVHAAFVTVYVVTLVLTELITNNAAAAIMLPIALGFGQAFDASPMPFILAVLYGASASFLTPYGYQTNLIVYSAGNYRLFDYIKMGLPVSLLYSATVLTVVPVFFPYIAH